MQRPREPPGLQKLGPKNYHPAMASPRASLAVTLVSIVSLVVALVARPASAAQCFEAIDEGTAKALFDRHSGRPAEE